MYLKIGKLHEETDGFSVIELLLVLIFIVLIGFVGWYVYHTDHKITNNKTTASTVSKPVSYFTITQWGVRAAYSGDLTLEYAVVNASSTLPYDYAGFTSSQLDSASSSCLSDDQQSGIVAVGLFERFSASQAYVAGDAATPTGQTAAQYAATLSSSAYGHVGNYYFFYVSPQATCATDTASQTVFNETQTAVKALLPELQAAPSS